VEQSSVWLVTGLASPSEINVDQNNVYWSDSILNSISGVPKNGGSTFVIAPPQATALSSLRFDDTYIYYWQGAVIMRVRKDGTASPQIVTTTSAQGIALGVDSTSLYFLAPPFASSSRDAANTTQLLRVPKGGGTPTPYATLGLVSGDLSTPIVAAVSDDRAMYVLGFMTNGPRLFCFIESFAFGGTDGGATVNGIAGCSGSMAVDATNVYAGGYMAGLQAYSKDDPGVVGQVPGVGSPFAGASCGVVWADSSGIHWTGITTSETNHVGTPYSQGAMATQLIAPGVGPVVSLIADGDNIYWTESGHGAIGRLRLP
jgi:hypothetical protein